MIFIVESFINCLSSWHKCYVLLLWRYMTYVVSICLPLEGKRYVLWLWRYMTYVVSILAVASYYGIMSILVMSICIEPGQWESHKYSGVLLSQVGEKVIWLFWSALVDYVIDLWSWPYWYASYVAQGGVRCKSGHALHLHFWGSIVLKPYVGMKWIWGVFFSFIWEVLFYL
jgi:hypothetical protein